LGQPSERARSGASQMLSVRDRAGRQGPSYNLV